MRAGLIAALSAVFILVPLTAQAQQSQPSLANSPNVVQWIKMDGSMADLLQRGYRVVSVDEVITNPPVQDVMTTFYLSRGADLVRCGEGARLISERYWVTSCARIAAPYEVKDK